MEKINTPTENGLKETNDSLKYEKVLTSLIFKKKCQHKEQYFICLERPENLITRVNESVSKQGLFISTETYQTAKSLPLNHSLGMAFNLMVSCNPVISDPRNKLPFYGDFPEVPHNTSASISIIRLLVRVTPNCQEVWEPFRLTATSSYVSQFEKQKMNF